MVFLTKISLASFSNAKGRLGRCDAGPSRDNRFPVGPVMAFVDQFDLPKQSAVATCEFVRLNSLDSGLSFKVTAGGVETLSDH